MDEKLIDAQVANWLVVVFLFLGVTISVLIYLFIPKPKLTLQPTYSIYIIPHSEQRNEDIFNHVIDYEGGLVTIFISDLGDIYMNHVTAALAQAMLPLTSVVKSQAYIQTLKKIEELLCDCYGVDKGGYKRKVQEIKNQLTIKWRADFFIFNFVSLYTIEPNS
ncbi:MAG: hypothetical protein H6779_00425 [Candidatus Nomurabacteria bacterium]|nr:MAG: hypothetical protein H6779_00425 [Candidatus Nomurabacteria bacterium]